MTLSKLKKNVTVSELACQHVVNRYSENQIWSFFDPRLLAVLEVLRNEIIKAPIVVNTSTLRQRGLRCNCCQLVADKTKANKVYMSSHCSGKGIDFSMSTMSAEQIRQLIDRNKDKLPYPVRIEKDVNWVHIDVMTTGTEKIQYLKV